MPILRIFPRQTNATPKNDYVCIGSPGLFIPDDISELHISVTFTWDLQFAKVLADQWSRYGHVKIGGPATGMRGEAFSPGLYLKHGYTITSRGCHNHCWFCSVPKREGSLRELPISDGWILLDDNILACSEQHIRAVFDMLKRQKQRPEFRGGFEAKILKSWYIELFRDVKPKQIFFAYDTPDDLPPLEHAAHLFRETGYGNRSILRCYVLIGCPSDSFDFATKRLETVKALGFCPMAMLYRDFKGDTTPEWRRFQRSWARPAAIYSPKWHHPLFL